MFHCLVLAEFKINGRGQIENAHYLNTKDSRFLDYVPSSILAKIQNRFPPDKLEMGKGSFLIAESIDPSIIYRNV